MEEVKKPLIALCHAEGDSEFQRLQKALGALGDLREFSFALDQSVSLENETENTSNYGAVFLDQRLFPKLNRVPSNLCLYNTESIAFIDLQKPTLSHLTEYSCLNLNKTSLSDLVRICLSIINKKPTAGVGQFIEKGSLIVGEKIQNISSLGKTLDAFHTYVIEEKQPLGPRLPEARQMIAALVTEALTRAHESKQDYPITDIQLAATNEKIILTMRFPQGNLDPTKILSLATKASSLSWFLAWQSADLLAVVHHQKYSEIEVKAFLYAGASEANTASYRSIVFQQTQIDQKSINLLATPKNFTFSHISELQNNTKARQVAESRLQAKLDLEENQENKIDPATRLKLTELENQVHVLKSAINQKDELVKHNIAQATEAKNALKEKRAELLTALKKNEKETELLRRQVAEYERKLQHAKDEEDKNATTPKANDIVGENAELQKNLKQATIEVQKLTEALSLEQKKFALIDQKLKDLKMEQVAKEKEIIDLKKNIELLKREVVKSSHPSASVDGKLSASAATSGNTDKTIIRDLQAKEEGYKQEIKKLQFKIENTEKTTKAAIAEMTDKNKLIERKLEESKTRELASQRKIEELQTKLKRGGAEKPTPTGASSTSEGSTGSKAA